MRNQKWILCGVLAAVMCLSLTACMTSGGVQPQVTTRTEYMPEATARVGTPSVTPVPDGFDWVTGAGMIEGNINRISEVQDSRVVVHGDTALVAVKFTSAYQGRMTERIREMVAAEVMKADPAVKTVAVTAEDSDVTRVYELAEKVRGGSPADSLGADIEEIVRNATTMR